MTIVAVILGMAVLGVFHRCADAGASANRGDAGSILFYAPVAFFCGPALNNMSIVAASFFLSAVAAVLASSSKRALGRARASSSAAPAARAMAG